MSVVSSGSRSTILLYTILIFTLFLVVIDFSNVYATQNGRVIYVDLSQFQFEPGRIVVNRGERVVFKLRSLDVTHGFYIDGYGVDAVVEPGDVVTLSIVATQVGKFKIRCSVTCGPLHPFMVGELVVVDGGVNTPFILSLFAVGLVGLLPLLAGRR